MYTTSVRPIDFWFKGTKPNFNVVEAHSRDKEDDQSSTNRQGLPKLSIFTLFLNLRRIKYVKQVVSFFFKKLYSKSRLFP